MDYKAIIGTLRRAREELDMHQQDVGDAVGVTKAAISNWENGQRIATVDILEAWSNAVGLDMRVALVPQGRVSPARKIVDRAAQLRQEDATAVLDFMDLLPSLEGAQREMLMAFVQTLRSHRGEAQARRQTS